MLKNLFILILFFMGVLVVNAANTPHLLPWPQKVEWTKSDFRIRDVALSVPDSLSNKFSDWVTECGGTVNQKSSRVLKVVFVTKLPAVQVNPEEAYRLTVSSSLITIEAVSGKGVYWALQTLRQLTVKKGEYTVVAGCEITDWPAFRVRGFMQDVGRSYISMNELKREIATLSQYKVNVFHWHLTEDLGWRLESKLFPMLNDSSNFVRMPGKYYTIAEARELVVFCKEHNVLLIPEIDMPGHSAAFRKAFRHDMQSKEGMAILKLLMDEVCEVFEDVPYLHIGTDEVEFTNPAFVPEMISYIRKKGMKVISWNPGWKYKAGEIDMIQMWSYRGKPHKDIPVIDSRLHYANHFDSFADIVGLYNSNIAEQQQGSQDYAGTIVAFWHDRLVQPEQNMIIENAFYPAILAIAERAWRGGGDEYFYTKGTMLDAEGTRGFDAFVNFESRMLWHKEHSLKELPIAYVRQTNVKWRITDAFPNDGDLLKSFPPEQELKESYNYQGKRFDTRKAVGAGIYLRHVWGKTVPSFYTDPQPNHTAYAYTWVWSPVGQKVGLWASTQNYSRSEKDLPPPQGKWDYRESRIYINDKEVLPPVWTASHVEKSNEIPLGNENFEGRYPLQLTLQKGWNKVLLKLPIGNFSTPEVRLQKWMFTFVFVTPDGKKAVDGLIYSPDKEK